MPQEGGSARGLSGGSGGGDGLEEVAVEADAGGKVFQGKGFVGGVAAAIRQGEAEEEGVNTEDGFEAIGDDGDGTAFTDEGGCGPAEGGAEGVLGGAAESGVRIDAVGGTAVAGVDFQADAGGAVAAEVGGDECLDSVGILAGNEAEAELGGGGGGEDGFGALALVAAGDAVEFGGGACPGAFDGGVTRLAKEGGGAGKAEEVLVCEGEAGPGLALPVGQRDDVVVKTLDGDAAIGVVEGGEEAGELGDGIGDCAAVDAGVEVFVGAVEADFQAGDAAESVGEGGDAGADHAGVGDGDDIAGKVMAVGGEETGEAGAADFLLALDEEDEVDRQFAAGGEGGFDAEDVGEDLAFVVGGATGGDDAVLDVRLKGVVVPEVEGVHGLDIVVAVDEDGAAAGSVGVAGGDDGVAGGGVDGGLEADGAEAVGEPIGTGGGIGVVGGISGDAGEAEEAHEGVDLIGQRLVHGCKSGFVGNSDQRNASHTNLKENCHAPIDIS